MRVLVACEFSGAVRDAFRALGHEAWSVDLEPCERDPAFHFRGDVFEFLERWPPGSWDLLIAHPPCTYLTNSGVRWLYKGGRGRRRDPKRWRDMRAAREFFMRLLMLPIPRVAVENPIPHGFAELPAYNQVIQPWQFGHGEVKATCLWLRGLPPLKPSRVVKGRKPRVHHASPSGDRWKERSRTLAGIARAMAKQWSRT